MSRRAYSAVALAAVMMISACAGKPVGGPTSGPVLSQTGSSSPVSSVSSSTPPPPPTWKLGTPPASTPTSILRDVAATDATHAWAVGSDAYTPTEQYTTGVPLVLQWDGRQWTRMPLPDVTWKGGLNLVAAGSPTDVWAVGDMAMQSGDPLAIHGDGTTCHG